MRKLFRRCLLVLAFTNPLVKIRSLRLISQMLWICVSQTSRRSLTRMGSCLIKDIEDLISIFRCRGKTWTCWLKLSERKRWVFPTALRKLFIKRPITLEHFKFPREKLNKLRTNYFSALFPPSFTRFYFSRVFTIFIYLLQFCHMTWQILYTTLQWLNEYIQILHIYE